MWPLRPCMIQSLAHLSFILSSVKHWTVIIVCSTELSRTSLAPSLCSHYIDNSILTCQAGPLPSQGLCTCFLPSLHFTYLTSTHSWVLNLNDSSSNNSSQTPAPVIPHVCGITVGNYIPHEGTVHGCIAHLCTLITVPSISYVLAKYLLNEHLSVSSQLSPLLT